MERVITVRGKKWIASAGETAVGPGKVPTGMWVFFRSGSETRTALSAARLWEFPAMSDAELEMLFER